MIVGGTAFFWNIDDHPRFVISDPELNPLKIVHVNVTTFRPRTANKIQAMKDAIADPACILDRGEHPLLTAEKSCVYYVGARHCSAAEFEDKIEKGLWRVHDIPASELVLLKMRRGATTTLHLEQQYEDILRDQGLHPL